MDTSTSLTFGPPKIPACHDPLPGTGHSLGPIARDHVVYDNAHEVWLKFSTLCEVHHPRLHRRAECYMHGLSWRPHPLKSVSFPSGKGQRCPARRVALAMELLMQAPCPAANRTGLSVMELFSFCPEVSVEFDSIFGRRRRRVLPGRHRNHV